MEGGGTVNGSLQTKMTARHHVFTILSDVGVRQAAGFVIHAFNVCRGMSDKKMCSPITDGKAQETAKKGKIDIIVPLQSGTFTTPLSYIFFSPLFFRNQLITIICDQTFFLGPEK